MNKPSEYVAPRIFEERAGGDHAVLLLYGLSGTPFNVTYLAKKLYQAGFSVRIPHISGYGKGVSKHSANKWQDWYAEAAAHFEDLSRNYRSVSVAGLCTGALLAICLAAEKGNRVSSLSLMATPLFLDGWALPWYKFLLPLIIHTPLRRYLSYVEQDPYGIKNAQLRELVESGMKKKGAGIAYSKIPMSKIGEMHKLTAAARNCLHSISTPTLILHAEEDDVASPKNADYLEFHLGAASVRKIILKDSYHLVTVDNERDRVADETSRFFKGRPSLKLATITGMNAQQLQAEAEVEKRSRLPFSNIFPAT